MKKLVIITVLSLISFGINAQTSEQQQTGKENIEKVDVKQKTMEFQLDITPKLEADGSYSPSEQALVFATSDQTDYENIEYPKYQGANSKILIIFTEQKNMTMQNGKMFSTGNHPVEALVPMLHLKNAGFEFDILTPTGKPVVFEMWAMPTKDENVMGIYNKLKTEFENPGSLQDFVKTSLDNLNDYAGVFVPGGHGVMLGIPEDENVGSVLRKAHQNDIYTITLCHGPGALLATALGGNEFIYDGYKMAVFPDAMDMQTPIFGYLPGEMPWMVEKKLKEFGVTIVNQEADSTCTVDRKLITGASPLAANELGKLAVKTLLSN